MDRCIVWTFYERVTFNVEIKLVQKLVLCLLPLMHHLLCILWMQTMQSVKKWAFHELVWKTGLKSCCYFPSHQTSPLPSAATWPVLCCSSPLLFCPWEVRDTRSLDVGFCFFWLAYQWDAFELFRKTLLNIFFLERKMLKPYSWGFKREFSFSFCI